MLIMGYEKLDQDKIKVISDYYIKFGLEQTAKDFLIKSETVMRYVRHAKNKLGVDIEHNKTLATLPTRPPIMNPIR